MIFSSNGHFEWKKLSDGEKLFNSIDLSHVIRLTTQESKAHGEHLKSHICNFPMNPLGTKFYISMIFSKF